MITQFISGFMSGLSDQGKKLLAIALIVVIVALFDRLLIGPTMSRLATIDEETAKEEESIKGDLHFLGYKDRILKEAKAVDSYLADNLPVEKDVDTGLLKKIEIIATKANVTLVKETIAAVLQEEDTLKYSADVECSGKLTDVITFMHLINTSNELTKVVKFNLGSKKADSDDIKATMTITKVIVSKKPLPKQETPAPSGVNQTDASNVKKN